MQSGPDIAARPASLKTPVPAAILRMATEKHNRAAEGSAHSAIV
jgi:hypothetical protein